MQKFFVDKHRLRMRIGAKRAETSMQRVRVPTELASRMPPLVVGFHLRLFLVETLAQAKTSIVAGGVHPNQGQADVRTLHHQLAMLFSALPHPLPCQLYFSAGNHPFSALVQLMRFFLCVCVRRMDFFFQMRSSHTRGKDSYCYRLFRGVGGSSIKKI